MTWNGSRESIFIVPLDDDNDLIADSWEKEQVREWNTQYGTNETVGTDFFGKTDDKELRDPDGATNTDGGANLPAHKAAGDSLTVFQEYRGYILDYDPHGFVGGHIRLGTHEKDLLVETDLMENVPHMPSVADMRGILTNTADGFIDSADGAGIWMYYVIDETAAAPHQTFGTTGGTATDAAADMNAWAANHDNNALDGFVHIIFADKRNDNPTGGTAASFGAYVFVERKWDQSQTHMFNFQDALSRTAAHEITHLLLDTANANGFGPGEHIGDPDPSDPPNGANDETYLMYDGYSVPGQTVIVFSNPTRRQLDLTSKQSVER